MPPNEPSLKEQTDHLLSVTHKTTALGKLLESSDVLADSSDPAAIGEAMNFIFKELQVLEGIVSRLAGEIDRLHSR